MLTCQSVQRGRQQSRLGSGENCRDSGLLTRMLTFLLTGFFRAASAKAEARRGDASLLNGVSSRCPYSGQQEPDPVRNGPRSTLTTMLTCTPQQHASATSVPQTSALSAGKAATRPL